MALEFIGGALFTLLYDGVKKAMARTTKFKSLLGDLKSTLDSLQPRIIQQIGEHNVELGLPNEEIQDLQRQMEEGAKLIGKLCKVGMWNCCIWCNCCNCIEASYTDQLTELDRSLRRLLEILKLQEARDVKELLILGRRNADRLDQLERRQSDLLKMQQEAMDILRAQQEPRDVQEFPGRNTVSTVHQQIEGNGVQQVALLDRGGAALGAVFQLLFDAVMQAKDKSKIFKRAFGDLKSTLDVLKPPIEEMTEYNKVLHLPKDEVESFRILMEKGVELVHKCSKVRQRASYKKHEYTSKLYEFNESLHRLLSILKVQIASYVKKTLVSINNIETEIKQIEESGVVQIQFESKSWCPVFNQPPSPTGGLDVLSVHGTKNVKEILDFAGNIEAGVKRIEGSGVVENQTEVAVAEPTSSTIRLDVMNIQRRRDGKETSVSVSNMMPAGVKRLPSLTVGLDAPLRRLKMMLLKDELSLVVLTGPQGCGKTTLAKKFCEDEKVKDKFKFNIFFVSVSENPNMDLIVQQLYRQKGYQLVPALQDEAIALNWLQRFLEETRRFPSLLVLDDVGPGSESLLDKFDEFKRSNFKILVTSRFEFPRFGSCCLKSLNDEDTMTRSHHSASLGEKSSYVPKDLGKKVSESLTRSVLEPSILQLVFRKNLSLPIFAGSKISDEEKKPLQILLVDKTNISTGVGHHKMFPISLPRPIKVQIVVLDGEFPWPDHKWTSEEFDKNILRERIGKQPLLCGEVCVTVRDGFATIGDIEFTDNSSWIRSGKFRLGARVAPGTGYQGSRILEAMTDAFVVEDPHEELYKKHHPPMLEDEVWRLEKIAEDGVFHHRLSSENIHTVQDFLKLFIVDPSKLRRILGGISTKTWEVIVEHAKTCVMGNKMYIFRGSHDTIYLNPICQVERAVINGQVVPTRDLRNIKRTYIGKLVKEAYANWNSLEEAGAMLNNETALLTQGDDVVEQYPNPPLAVLKASEQNAHVAEVQKASDQNVHVAAVLKASDPNAHVFSLDFSPAEETVSDSSISDYYSTDDELTYQGR